MYVYISDLAVAMSGVTNNMYLDISTGAFLLKKDLPSSKNYLRIPRIDSNSLALEYIGEKSVPQKTKRKLKKFTEDPKFGSYFHRTVNDEGLYDDWSEFQKKREYEIAENWCNANNIRYSLKKKYTDNLQKYFR